jgi:hypothetical protein
MAKKKTEDKELKVEAPTKKEAVKIEIPNTKMVDIIMNGVKYNVGRDVASVLVNSKRAKLA